MGRTGGLVSICVPVLNGADVIEHALDSVLAQSYEPIEVVVTDDHSSDGTAGLVRERYGDAVRLLVNRRRQGLCGNHNVAIRACRGEYVKFVHHDDTLGPECVAKMVDALSRHARAGLVFARRILKADEAAHDESRFEGYTELHNDFRGLESINDGRILLTQWLSRGFPRNWIGEPTAVMVTREALTEAGLFSPRVRQLMDMDLWARILAAGFDAAFLDERLVTYRTSIESSTGRTVARSAHWVDPLWILEHLMTVDAAQAQFPELEERRREQRRLAFRSALRSASPTGGGYPLRPYLQYLHARGTSAIRSRLGSRGGPSVPRLSAGDVKAS